MTSEEPGFDQPQAAPADTVTPPIISVDERTVEAPEPVETVAKPAEKKSTAAKKPATKTAASKTAATKAAASKATAAKSTVSKSAAGKTAASKTAASKTAASKSTASKSTATKATGAKASTATKATGAKATTAKQASTKPASAKSATAKAATTKTAVTKATTAKDSATKTAAASKAAARTASTPTKSEKPTPEKAAVETTAAEALAVETPAVETTAPDRPAPVDAPAALDESATVTAEPAGTALEVKPSTASTVTVTSTDAATADAEAPAATVAPVEKAAAKPAPSAPDPSKAEVVLSIEGLTKRFGDNVAVDGISLEVLEGSFYGIVGPNGAGKTTTLSMVTGLLRPDSGRVLVHGIDVWKDPVKAKRTIGVLPDRLRLFDRLTGAQLLYYSGTLRGLSRDDVRARSADLAAALGIEDALGRLVADYSAGMTKKIALAAAMIHSPRLLVLDEPFESVDPVSAANVIDILQKYVAAGGTVVLSSHGMDLIQRVCDSVAIIVRGTVPAAGSVHDVRGEGTLEDRFVDLAGGRKTAEGMEWLHTFSD